MSNYLGTGALRDQWKKIYTARTPKTGVSERLQKFDKEFAKYFGGNKYTEDKANKLAPGDAESAYSQVLGLETFIKDLKEPKVPKWTPAEKKFLGDLKSELTAASLILSDVMSKAKVKNLQQK